MMDFFFFFNRVFPLPQTEHWESHPEVSEIVDLQRSSMAVSRGSLVAREEKLVFATALSPISKVANKFELLKGSIDDDS